MSEFKCFRGFTSRTGKVYFHDNVISEAEYDKLHLADKMYFLRIVGTPRYKQPNRDDNETFPVVMPFDKPNPDDLDMGYNDADDSDSGSSNDD